MTNSTYPASKSKANEEDFNPLYLLGLLVNGWKTILGCALLSLIIGITYSRYAYQPIYKTDALISRKVKIIGIFPANSHSPIVYPLALTKQGQKNKEAVQFEKFIKSSKQAKAIFQKYGFSVKS